jgi:hypothetical protein
MKFAELITEKGNGIETWQVSNMSGYVKKFRKIDGWWEKPVEVDRWMKGHEIPSDPIRASKERLAKAQAKYGAHVDAHTALRWMKDDEEDEKEERRETKAKAAAKKANAQTAFQIVAAGEDAIGQSFPDGDPSDYLRDYLDKHDLEWSDVNAAFKKVHKKEFYPYLADMWDDHARDALHDAKGGAYGEHYDNEWFAQRNPWK